MLSEVLAILRTVWLLLSLVMRLGRFILCVCLHFFFFLSRHRCDDDQPNYRNSRPHSKTVAALSVDRKSVSFVSRRGRHRTRSSKPAGVAPEQAAGDGDGPRLSPPPKPDARSFAAGLAACARGISCGYTEGFSRGLELIEAMRTGDGGAPSPDIIAYREVVNIYGR